MGKNRIFKSGFIQEFQPGDSEREIENTILYHYTEANALLSILENGSIRFSDIRYMNDRSETVFFVKRLRKHGRRFRHGRLATI